jgi:hypothetical protein
LVKQVLDVLAHCRIWLRELTGKQSENLSKDTLVVFCLVLPLLLLLLSLLCFLGLYDERARTHIVSDPLTSTGRRRRRRARVYLRGLRVLARVAHFEHDGQGLRGFLDRGGGYLGRQVLQETVVPWL